MTHKLKHCQRAQSPTLLYQLPAATEYYRSRWHLLSDDERCLPVDDAEEKPLPCWTAAAQYRGISDRDSSVLSTDTAADSWMTL